MIYRRFSGFEARTPLPQSNSYAMTCGQTQIDIDGIRIKVRGIRACAHHRIGSIAVACGTCDAVHSMCERRIV
jgi:hypothetical protein